MDVLVNSTSAVSVTLGVGAIEEAEHFTYLASVVDIQGGSETDHCLALPRTTR